ncbi:hypothetical protein [Allorhodopirellula heiligendammensis]|nr:hypothetical protein [Allorhodopirellula heiligendammensis]
MLKRPVEPWGFVWSDDIPATFSEAEFSLARMSIVQAYGSFENYLTLTRGEVDRWRHHRGIGSLEGKTNDENRNLSLSQFCKTIGCSFDLFAEYESLFEFFQECRNCIVHRESYANKRLVELADSEEMAKCNNNWPFSQSNTLLPDWPVFRADEIIALQPKHAILAAAVYYKIAKCIDTFIVSSFGPEGMIFMAIHHSLCADDHPSRLSSHTSYESAILKFLTNRYRVKDATRHEINVGITELDLHKKVRTCFNSLYWNKYKV